MTVRVAVVGGGAMGRHHARVYNELPGVELVGVADADVTTAAGLARRYGGQPFTSVQALLETVRPAAVSLAVPTVDHCAVGLDIMAAGCHVLIEKPIAGTVAEGNALITAAAQHGVTLMIGHVERFNPAVIALKERLAAGELGRVFQLDARRQGPFPARVKDIGVVIDLAVHDLDVIRYVSQAEPIRVYAETEQRIHSSHEDLLTAQLRLSDGAVATLNVNWLTPTKIRELLVTGERGMFRVDYLTQDLSFFENATADAADWEPLRMLRGVSEGRMIRYVVAKQEPLRAELEAFLAAVRGEATVAVSGADGLQALALAEALVTSGHEHRIVTLQPTS